ncbi:dihydroorotate dehydrogenase electron transfer subunit [Aquibacillus sp. 3ASR75-11]|uniref:Dihydroorotate dehydrogenase B (NAD(+)), electron transfer subunit n=1 Tax=Terrihalobacillus insolitus TaxID=2950438 RepID=A0A9X3WPY8_9BACI|nr:dihydroorotate dehydrogenase electron transfer subunit [Terrihalobacillus insolitus]MDC3412859.1 dihydroorotate dehydrogenase electron transfer subunit [Terrihalobacillus insolitus]MDC3423665.1 dihydroorotate dehydrogenase electron transfer subunit [Terrihalobacillus insolitus]
MKKAQAVLADKRKIAKDTYEMELTVEEMNVIPTPGQFAHIRIGNGSAHMLRRPISIADVDPIQNTLTIIFKVIGGGTNELSHCQVGDELDVLIGCGQGYPVEDLAIQKALLIGGGIGVPPLYYLAKRLREQGIEVTSILGFQTKEHVFYEKEFSLLGGVQIVTNDGSYGHKGFVTDVVPPVSDFGSYFTCGPTGMLKAVTHQLKGQKGYISIEERMGCGIGACYACVVPIADGEGFRKICKDGPVFKAEEVVL